MSLFHAFFFLVNIISQIFSSCRNITSVKAETDIETVILLFPVSPLLYGALHPNSDFFKALRFHDRGLYESDTLLYLLPCLVALGLHAAGSLLRVDFCVVALITILVFECAVIGKFDFLDEIAFALCLSALVGSRYKDTALPAVRIQDMIVVAAMALELALILPRKDYLYPMVLCYVMGIWHFALCRFKLQFSFLEYFGLLSWTCIVVLMGIKFEPVMTSSMTFNSREVFYVVHCGVACVFVILHWIAFIFTAPLLFRYLGLNIMGNVTLRCVTFLTLFSASIPVLLLPSLRYFLNGYDPLIWVTDFLLLGSSDRLYLCFYWSFIITASVLAAQLLSNNSKSPKFCIRKLFHLLMVLILAPGILIEKFFTFTILAMGVAFCAFLVLETFRVLVLVPSGEDVIYTYYLQFLEEKENKRSWISSNITLLVGCAVPAFLWAYWGDIPPCIMAPLGSPMSHRISTCSYLSGDPNWEDWTDNLKLLDTVKLLLPHLGWIVIGVGDSFAAVIGWKYGRHRWWGTNRTVEGSLAMFLSTVATSLAVVCISLGTSQLSFHNIIEELLSPIVIIPIMSTFLLATLLEAFTNENDNLILPLFSSAAYVAITAIMV